MLAARAERKMSLMRLPFVNLCKKGAVSSTIESLRFISLSLRVFSRLETWIDAAVIDLVSTYQSMFLAT